MCNEYQRNKTMEEALRAFDKRGLPLFKWEAGLIPNALQAQPSIRIRDSGVIVRLADGQLQGSMTTWAWPGPKGPVFNFRSEGRDFSHSDRVLILADGFFEYTPGKAKLKDRHLFALPGEDWFWIAGLVKEGCFSMLTTAPGPDVAPYHDRQIVTLPLETGMDWLSLARPEAEILRAPPAGTFTVTTLRKDGTEPNGDLFA